MHRNAFLVFAATVSIIYAIGNLLVPAWVHELHGLTSSPSASLVLAFSARRCWDWVSLCGWPAIVWILTRSRQSCGGGGCGCRVYCQRLCDNGGANEREGLGSRCGPGASSAGLRLFWLCKTLGCTQIRAAGPSLA